MKKIRKISTILFSMLLVLSASFGTYALCGNVTGGGLSQTEITDEEKNNENTQNSDSSSEKVDNSIDSSTEGKSSESGGSSEETTVTVTATETAEYTYNSSGDYWFYTDGKFPQSAVTSSSTISNLQASATLTGETYAIGNETFSVFEYDGNEYIHVSSSGKNVSTASDSGTWFLVEPIVWIVGYGSSEPDAGGVAVSKDVISYGAYSTTSTSATFTSLFNSTKENSAAAVSSGSLIYSDIDTVTYDAFVSTVAQTTVLSVNLGNEGDSNTTITSSGYRVASAYEIEEMGGTYSASCSNLVAYLMNGSTTSTSVAYWTRDLAAEIGSFTYDGALNNGVYVTAEGTLNNAKLKNAFGARLSTKTTAPEASSTAAIYADAEAIKGYSINMGYFPQSEISNVSGLTDVTSSLAYGENCYVTVSGSYYLCEEIIWDVIAYYDESGEAVYDFDGLDLTTLSSGTQVVALSRYALAAMAFNEDGYWLWGSGATMYDWLNNDFYDNAFTDEEKASIVAYDDSETAGETPNTYWTVYSDIDATYANVWMLSITEVDMWFDISEGYSDSLICYNTAYCVATGDDEDGACYWWLRSCGYDFFCACNVDTIGYIVYYDYGVGDVFEAVRPALLINL